MDMPTALAAPLDFPSSPVNGAQYRGYTFNGVGWQGGFQAQGPSNAEQFFDPTGLVNLDIPVPSWAKGVTLDGSVYTTGGAAVVMRVSFDGTTFGAGASDYNNAAAQHATGTQGYVGMTTTANNFMYLGVNADSVTVPHNFSAEMSLTRPNASALFHLKTYTKMYDSAATLQYRTWWGNSTVMPALSGANLAIVRVKWLGDLAQQPNGVSIVDAPADGGEYVRVNNVWRKKSQTFVLDGLTQLDVDVPATAKVMRLDGMVFWAAISANNAVTWRASTDGTNFLAGASDYFYGGLIHYAGSAGYGNLVPTNEAYGRLTFPFDTTTQPGRIRWLFPVIKSTNINALHSGTVNTGYYNTPTSNTYTDAQFTSGVQSGANLSIKKLRFFNGPVGGAFGNGSLINVDWMY
jgi:hypothetical protein